MPSTSNEGGSCKEKAPRLYHTKSRNGCQRCRARRVKCNETRPICGNCNRHGVACMYKQPQTSIKTSTPERTWPPPEAFKVDILSEYRPTRVTPWDSAELQQLLADMEGDKEAIEPPESKARRLLELRLQQHFIEHTSRTLSACDSPRVRTTWAVEVPKLALASESVLYGMLALSAIYLLKSHPEDQELVIAHQAYSALSIRHQRVAIASLTSGCADAVLFASTLIYTNTFASLQERALDPWTPPMQWLLIGRGCGSVYGATFDKLNDLHADKIMPIVTAEPNINDGTVIFADSNRCGFEPVLEYDLTSEVWDEETRKAYEKALSYIGGVRIAIEGGEHQLSTCRRLLAFGLFCPAKLCDFLMEIRPRALVVLAHYFALFAHMENIWWIGDLARREVESIQRALPLEWHELMKGPLVSVGLAVAV